MSRKQQIESMLNDDPKDPFLRYALGMEHMSEGDQARAVQAFKETIRDNPDYVPAYFQWAQALVRLGRPDDAKDVLVNGIKVANGVADTHAAGEMEGLLSSL